MHDGCYPIWQWGVLMTLVQLTTWYDNAELGDSDVLLS
jgi:hypothetical protein